MRARSQISRSIAVVAVAALGALTARAERPAAETATEAAPADTLSTREERELLAMIEAARPARRARQVRFSNGPRAVPRARGAALSRALSLGIGDHLSTKHLLWARPSKELLSAVPGPRPRSLLWPVVGGKWGRGFGFTRKVRTELRHNGIDIGAKLGTPVRAAAEGLVIYSDNTLRDLGNAVMILHPGGWTTLYGHNLRTTVQPGWYVKRGERIALVGQTGAAWGPHVHFELRDNGRWRDPAPFITGYQDETLDGPLVELDGESKTEAGAPAAERKAAAVTPAPPATRDESEAAVAEVEAAAEQATPLPFEVGTRKAAERLLRAAPPEGHDGVLGRKFSNLLWPVKGATLGRAFDGRGHRALDLHAAPGSPVRVVADGVVVYSGAKLPGYGHAIVVLHREGWVTVYGSVEPDGAAEAGARVLRGEWIGRVAEASRAAPKERRASHLHFEWLVAGQRRDPSASFTGH